MAKNLVIVESPAKAKTIEGFLGKDFKVLSSFGHIRDLSHKDMGVDIPGGFIPNYEVSALIFGRVKASFPKENVKEKREISAKTPQRIFKSSRFVLFVKSMSCPGKSITYQWEYNP